MSVEGVPWISLERGRLHVDERCNATVLGKMGDTACSLVVIVGPPFSCQSFTKCSACSFTVLAATQTTVRLADGHGAALGRAARDAARRQARARRRIGPRTASRYISGPLKFGQEAAGLSFS